MKLIEEFKKFVLRGNVIDLAVGVIIGAAFGKIVTSLVNDMIMPALGYIISDVKFTDLKITLAEKVMDGNTMVKDAITLNYGNFLQTMFDFTIIAIAIFIFIKIVNKIHHKEAAKPTPPPQPSAEEKLLTEIRDLLKK